MLLPEAGLDLLLDQLKALPAADRKAVLARLTPVERRRIRVRLTGRSAAPAAPESPWSQDIAARIGGAEAADAPLTAAGRKALADILDRGRGGQPAQSNRGASLVQTMGGLLRPRGKPA